MFIFAVTKLKNMAKEIERKFIVCADSFRLQSTGCRRMTQFYLSADPERTVRVRIADDGAWLTVKGLTSGCTRREWEYAIPVSDAREMQAIAVGRVVAKTRYIVPAGNGLCWEVDVFDGQLAGLVVAEIELPAEDAPFHRPDFIGREVTGDAAYYNSALALSDCLPPVE